MPVFPERLSFTRAIDVGGEWAYEAAAESSFALRSDSADIFK